MWKKQINCSEVSHIHYTFLKFDTVMRYLYGLRSLQIFVQLTNNHINICAFSIVLFVIGVILYKSNIFLYCIWFLVAYWFQVFSAHVCRTEPSEIIHYKLIIDVVLFNELQVPSSSWMDGWPCTGEREKPFNWLCWKSEMWFGGFEWCCNNSHWNDRVIGSSDLYDERLHVVNG